MTNPSPAMLDIIEDLLWHYHDIPVPVGFEGRGYQRRRAEQLYRRIVEQMEQESRREAA